MVNLNMNLVRVVRMLKGRDLFIFPDLKIHTITLGNKGADWTFADEELNQDSIVYSIGIGTDISFDLELIRKFNLKIFAFDPTEKSISWLKEQTLPENFHYFKIGLADYDGKASLFPPDNSNHISHTLLNSQYQNKDSYEIEVSTLKTLMKSNNHTKIDLLKMDVEGVEYGVLENILESGVEVKQLLVEFHHRFKNIGLDKTRKAVRKLKKSGYRLFSVSAMGEEYSFLKS